MKEVDVFVPIEKIHRAVFLIRGKKVILDYMIAELYHVETKALKRAVRRNSDRFPEDFMFQLNENEFENLRCQFGTSSDYGGRRYLPYAFTEQGVAMLSSVLKSKRAVAVNIEIMRSFVKLRELLSTHTELARQLEALETKYDAQIKVVFDAIRSLMVPPESSGFAEKKEKIGFKVTHNRK